MLFVHILPGLALLLFGLIYRKWPPRHINWIYGFRTKTAMRDQQTWDEANRYSARLLVRIAIAVILAGFICYYSISFPASIFIPLGLMLLLIVLHLLQTERHLKKKFYRRR